MSIPWIALLAPPQDPPPAGTGSQMTYFIQMGVMFAGVIGIMYFLVIRPQKKREAERQQMLASVRKNDRILTSGGIFGVVMSVKDNEVVLRIDDSANVRVRVARSAVAEIVSRGDDESD